MMDREKHTLKFFYAYALTPKPFSLAPLPTSQLLYITHLFQLQANLHLLLPDTRLDISKPISLRTTTSAHTATWFITVEIPNYSI